MIYTEAYIAKKLNGKFYQLQQRDHGKFVVVDRNELKEEPPEVPAVKLVPEYTPPVVRPDGFLWLEDIARAVCHVYGITRADFVSIRRARNLVAARQVFYWLAKRFTSHSFPMIGSWCNKDHSTVLHGVAKIDRDFASFAKQITECTSLLGVTLDQREAA